MITTIKFGKEFKQNSVMDQSSVQHGGSEWRGAWTIAP
jgi:hypothetical protein